MRLTLIVPSMCAVRIALQLLPSVPFVQHESNIAESVLIAFTNAPLIVHNLSWDCRSCSFSAQMVTISPVCFEILVLLTLLGCPYKVRQYDLLFRSHMMQLQSSEAVAIIEKVEQIEIELIRLSCPISVVSFDIFGFSVYECKLKVLISPDSKPITRL